MAGTDLAVSYERCRVVHREHGRSYYLVTRVLPRCKRKHVHALYGFTRTTDDLVDETTGSIVDRAARLRSWTERFWAELDGAVTHDPVLPAVRDTIERFDLDRRDFVVFLRSMTMDLTVTEYATYDDLLEYMAGSAAAIGTMMLPILAAGTASQAGLNPAELAAAREPARELGLAFS